MNVYVLMHTPDLDHDPEVVLVGVYDSIQKAQAKAQAPFMKPLQWRTTASVTVAEFDSEFFEIHEETVH